MWYWILNIGISIWVFFDARRRKMDSPVLWAIGSFLLMIFVIPLYFAKRSLIEGEVREGGTAWNVIKAFAICWTVIMFIIGLSGLMSVGEITNNTSSGAEQIGTAIGTAIGMGMIITLWVIVLVGALVIGLFLKKSSIVEKGPTGAMVVENSSNRYL